MHFLKKLSARQATHLDPKLTIVKYGLSIMGYINSSPAPIFLHVNITRFVSTWTWVYWPTTFTSLCRTHDSISIILKIHFKCRFLTPHFLDNIEQQFCILSHFCIILIVMSSLFISHGTMLILTWRSVPLFDQSSLSVPNWHFMSISAAHFLYTLLYKFRVSVHLNL